MAARMEVSARHVYRMVRVARDLGVPIPASRVPPGRLDRPPDPLDRLDVDLACDLVEWLQDECGLVELGVEVGQAEDTEWLDPGALLVAVSETLRDGLGRAVSYWALWASRRCHWLVPTEAGAEWRFVPPPDVPPRAARAAFEELTTTQMTVGLSRAAGRPIRPVSVRFPHARTAHAARLEALFECPVTFGAECSAFELSHADLDAPLPGANALLVEYLEVQCDALVEKLGAVEPVGERARRAVRRAMGREPLTLEEVARRCATSPRALQRALADGGTSFRAMLDDERRRVACEALARGEPVERVSDRVGFRDARSFRRAFRRWTGLGPRDWRRTAAPSD